MSLHGIKKEIKKEQPQSVHKSICYKIQLTSLLNLPNDPCYSWTPEIVRELSVLFPYESPRVCGMYIECRRS